MAASKWLGGINSASFASGAARILSELNAVHPFREGNGRTQNTFIAVLAERAGNPLDLSRLDPDAMLTAMVAGFNGNEKPLAALIHSLFRG